MCMTKLYRKLPLIKRIYPSLLKKWAALTWVGGYKVKKYKGLILLLNYKNHVDRHIGLHDDYEEEQLSYFLSHVKSGGDVFLDIGACFGLYSLRVAQLGTVKEIHAFEPDYRNYAQLLTQRSLNNFIDIIKAHDFALSDKEGKIQFELAVDNKTGLSKVSTAADTSKQLTTIACKTLDSVLSYTGRKIFIKMDVEDHELAALSGAVQTLKNNDCFLQVEVRTEPAVTALVKFMAAHGYNNIHHINNDYYFSKS